MEQFDSIFQLIVDNYKYTTNYLYANFDINENSLKGKLYTSFTEGTFDEDLPEIEIAKTLLSKLIDDAKDIILSDIFKYENDIYFLRSLPEDDHRVMGYRYRFLVYALQASSKKQDLTGYSDIRLEKAGKTIKVIKLPEVYI